MKREAQALKPEVNWSPESEAPVANMIDKSDKYILQLEQIHLTIGTNTFNKVTIIPILLSGSEAGG